MSWWFMTRAELATCCMPEDAASPGPMEGYMMDFVTIYEWIFGVPLH
jgi:hypothetical protein